MSSHFPTSPTADTIRDTVTRPGPRDTETLGERLKRVLAERKTAKKRPWSQRQLAQMLAGDDADQDKVEIVRRQVVRWANDQTAPEEPTARRLAELLDVSADSFVTDRAALQRGFGQALQEIQGSLRELGERVAALESRGGPRRPPRKS